MLRLGIFALALPEPAQVAGRTQRKELEPALLGNADSVLVVRLGASDIAIDLQNPAVKPQQFGLAETLVGRSLNGLRVDDELPRFVVSSCAQQRVRSLRSVLAGSVNFPPTDAQRSQPFLSKAKPASTSPSAISARPRCIQPLAILFLNPKRSDNSSTCSEIDFAWACSPFSNSAMTHASLAQAIVCG